MATNSSASSSRLARRSKNPLWRIGVSAVLGTSAGCGPLDNDDPTFHVRGVNLISDSPTLKFYLRDTSIAASAFNGSSSWHAAEVGAFDVGIKAVHPPNMNDDKEDDATETTVGTFVSQSFEESKDYTMFAYGTLADPKMLVMDSTGQRDKPDDNKLIYQVLNLSQDARTVDVYVTAPAASINEAKYVTTLAPGEYSGPQELSVQQDDDEDDANATRHTDLTLELRVPGTGQRIYTTPTLSAVEQTRVLMTIADNPDVGPSRIKMLQLSTDGSATLLVDPGDNARLRVVNGAAGSPPLDVVIGSFQNPIAQALAFRGSSAYGETGTGEIGLIATASGDSDNFAFIEEYAATQDQSYTAYAIGTQTDFDATIAVEDPRSVPTQSRFRFLTAAPSLDGEALDIYVLARGKTIQFPDDNSSTSDTAPQFPSVTYRSVTNYLTLEGASYDAYFVIADTEEIVAGPVAIDIPNGANQTLMLTDNESSSLEVITVSDAAP